MDRYGRAYMEAHAVFLPLEPEHHRVIPQSGVKQFIFPDGDRHNAIWDYFVTSSGRHFFSQCAEGDFSECFTLCEYFPRSNTVKKLFRFEDAVVNYPRAIRASKVHTSISEMRDGRLIMLSHTTAAAPGHPVWMPHQYYNHMWEGFAGSNLFIYDPAAGKVEDLGIPVRRESLYGGIYSPKADAYFAAGMMRGHVYRIDLKDKKVTDYGNLAEGACCCLRIASDGHVYFGTTCGELVRINTDTLEYEDLNLRARIDADQPVARGMMYGVNGPDGKFYFDPAWTERLHVFDPKTGAMGVVGSVMPEELSIYPWKGMIYGFDFDADNVLWYGLMTHGKPPHNGGETAFYLCSWDFLRGGKPVSYGLMGTERRRVLVFSEAHITGDLFIGADTNHWWDPVSMFQVDLKKLKADHAVGVKGPLTRDPYHYTRFQKGYEVYEGDLGKDAAPLYERIEKEKARTAPYQAMANEYGVQNARETYVTKFWREIGYADSNILSVFCGGDGVFTVLCGKEQFYRFRVRKGEILSAEKLLGRPADGRDGLKEKYQSIRLSANAGRRWMAYATAEAELDGGSRLVGTADGLLCVVGPDGFVRALGGVGVFGPVRDLCANAARTKVWGVAGDAEDQGMLFTYEDAAGIEQIGPVRTLCWRGGLAEECTLNLLSAVAISGDGNALAVGSADYKSALVEHYF